MSADPPESSPSIGPLPGQQAALVEELGTYLQRHRGRMAHAIEKGPAEGGELAGRKFASAMDGMLCALFRTASAKLYGSAEPGGTTLAAVGSYGRRTLSYASDLDVRLLTEDGSRGQRILEAFLYPLWDAKVNLGHQVTSIDELIELSARDLPSATSLLDLRAIAGDRQQIRVLQERVASALFCAGRVEGFLAELARSTQERVDRYGDSVYLLEPDVRNGPGGVRDFDVLHWTAKARWQVGHPRELVQMGVLLPREWEPIESAANFLYRLRNVLHLMGGRRNDRLSFDRQEQVAERLGYGSDPQGIERFMSDYYRHARVLARARDLVFLRAAPTAVRQSRPVLLGQGLALLSGQLTLASSLEEEPSLALRVYREATLRQLPVHPTARSQIAQAASGVRFCERLRESETARRLFVQLVTWVPRGPFPHGSVLAELHDVGLLTAMIPEFAPVVGRVHHDIYHVFTVDVHSVKAVDLLRELCRGDWLSEYPVASRVAAELARPTVVFFATLLHDVGKDIGGSNHSERGAVLAESILARLGLRPEERSEVQHLIRQHLTLYHAATRRDLDDPQTVDGFLEGVHGKEGLNELFVLTVCDVATTSPESLTQWKARMMDTLFLACEERLDRESSAVPKLAELARARVLLDWDRPAQEPRLIRFLEAMPERYTLFNEPGRIVRHARMVLDSAAPLARVEVIEVQGSYGEFAFFSEDRPGLLAMIAASIACCHGDVVAAQIYSFVDELGCPRALDLFWIEGGERMRTGRTLAVRCQDALQRQLNGSATPEQLVARLTSHSRWTGRPAPAVATRIHVDNRGSSQHTIVEVITQDRLGLLFELARAIQRAGCTISRAKINTEGNQVADVFYVEEAGGGRVTEPLRIQALEASILAAVGSLGAAGGGSAS